MGVKLTILTKYGYLADHSSNGWHLFEKSFEQCPLKPWALAVYIWWNATQLGIMIGHEIRIPINLNQDFMECPVLNVALFPKCFRSRVVFSLFSKPERRCFSTGCLKLSWGVYVVVKPQVEFQKHALPQKIAMHDWKKEKYSKHTFGPKQYSIKNWTGPYQWTPKLLELFLDTQV